MISASLIEDRRDKPFLSWSCTIFSGMSSTLENFPNNSQPRHGAKSDRHYVEFNTIKNLYMLYKPEYTHCTKMCVLNKPRSPLRTMRTFFHCVLPTLGVWQKRILCLSHTKMRSRTNLRRGVCVRFHREEFLQTLDKRCKRCAVTDSQSNSST